MNSKINLLDLFSGIGGFHLGLERAGFTFDKVFNSEIDKYANSVYKYNFKESINVGSVTDVRGKDLPKINAITFGSPCQDFSLAGRRAGLEGNRSSLISEAIRLISECRPDFFIWENVKGTFSSNNGEDFWAIIKAFTNIGGYRLEWQLLNTRWFLPQNRERIYLVGYLGEGRRREIFPIGESHRENQRYVHKKLMAKDCKKHIIKKYDTGHDGNTIYSVGGVATTQKALGGGQGGKGGIYEMLDKKVRRLTPIECERLQGFPDGWTEGQSDTQRYKQLGNAVSVPVVKAVGEKIYKCLRKNM